MDTEPLGLNSFPKVADGKGLLPQAVWIRFCSFFFFNVHTPHIWKVPRPGSKSKPWL